MLVPTESIAAVGASGLASEPGAAAVWAAGTGQTEYVAGPVDDHPEPGHNGAGPGAGVHAAFGVSRAAAAAPKGAGAAAGAGAAPERGDSSKAGSMAQLERDNPYSDGLVEELSAAGSPAEGDAAAQQYDGPYGDGSDLGVGVGLGSGAAAEGIPALHDIASLRVGTGRAAGEEGAAQRRGHHVGKRGGRQGGKARRRHAMAARQGGAGGRRVEPEQQGVAAAPGKRQRRRQYLDQCITDLGEVAGGGQQLADAARESLESSPKVRHWQARGGGPRGCGAVAAGNPAWMHTVGRLVRRAPLPHTCFMS